MIGVNDRIKAHDLSICTWNVRSLNKLGAVSQLEAVLKVYKADNIALQEMRWTGQGQKNLSSCDVYYSGHVSQALPPTILGRFFFFFFFVPPQS